MTKRKSKGAYMISAVAEMYEIHPQTLRLYEREGLLKPSRTEGNTRLYTDEDLQRLEFILSLARDLHHSSNARAHGRNAAPDPGIRAVHPARGVGAGLSCRRSVQRRDRAIAANPRPRRRFIKAQRLVKVSRCFPLWPSVTSVVKNFTPEPQRSLRATGEFHREYCPLNSPNFHLRATNRLLSATNF